MDAPQTEIGPTTPPATLAGPQIAAGSSSVPSAGSIDVFISYSSKNAEAALAVVATLEAAKITCWIAQRDISPGEVWADSIIKALNACRMMVLVFSPEANDSIQVLNEVERAVHKGRSIIVFRIADAMPTKSMEYFLSNRHWMNAFPQPLDPYLSHLPDVVTRALRPTEPTEPTEPTRPAPWAVPWPRPGRRQWRLDRPSVTPFVGRTDELSRLRERMVRPGGQIVAIVGPAGMGKTRLALEFAERETAVYPDGIFEIQGKDLGDAALLAARLLDIFDVPIDSQSEPERLVKFLASRRVLLVVDDVDLVPGVQACAAALRELGHPPGLDVLTTSRCWPEGVEPYPLIPLAAPPPPPSSPSEAAASLDVWAKSPAVELFCKRAESKTGFALNAANVAMVVGIAQQWDMLPAALELMADLLTDHELNRLAAKTPGGALEKSIDAALVQLAQESPEAIAVLCRLSVFVGGFTSEGASAMFAAEAGQSIDSFGPLDVPPAPPDDDPPVRSVLTMLHRRSLLISRQHPWGLRWYMLEVIRRRVQERAKKEWGEQRIKEWRRRHAEYVYGLGHRFEQQGSSTAEEWQEVDIERPNARAAVEFAMSEKNEWYARLCARIVAAGCPLLGQRGYWDDAFDRATKALAFVQPLLAVDDPDVLELKHQIANCHLGKVRYDVAEQLLIECLEVWRKRKDVSGEVRALNHLARLGEERRLLEKAEALAREALTKIDVLLAATPAPIPDLFERQRADVLNTLGSILQAQGDTVQGDAALPHYEEAQKMYEQSRAICERLNDRRGLARMLNNMATLAEKRRMPRKAFEYFRESRDRYREAGAPGQAAIAAYNMAFTAASRTWADVNIDALVREAFEAAGGDKAVNDQVAYCYWLTGDVAYRRGDFATARDQFQAGLKVFEKIGKPEDIVSMLQWLARALMELKQFEDALDWLNQAMEYLPKFKDEKTRTGTESELREQLRACDAGLALADQGPPAGAAGAAASVSPRTGAATDPAPAAAD